MRVTIVGSGFVGQTTAMRVVEKGLAEVVLIDIVEGLPQGLALDIRESSSIEGFEPNVTGTNDYADTAGSDVVVITAGFPRQPGMSRMDLLGKNAAVVRDVVVNVVPGSPHAVIVVVTNPLDEMTFLTSEVSGFPKRRVVGMAGVLDSARLRYFIAEELGVSPSAVEAMTLGSHGESMVPLPRHATVAGKPLAEMVDETTLERLYRRSRSRDRRAAEEGERLLRALRRYRQDGPGHRPGGARRAPRVRVVRGPVRDPGRVCRRPGPAVPSGRRGDRGARPERGRVGGASRGCRRHPREVRRPGEALAARGGSGGAP